MQNMNVQKQLLSVLETSRLLALWSPAETQNKLHVRPEAHYIHLKKKMALFFWINGFVISLFRKTEWIFLRIIFLSIQERESHSIPEKHYNISINPRDVSLFEHTTELSF